MSAKRTFSENPLPRSARLAAAACSLALFCGGLLTAGGCQRESAELERAAHREPANRPADLAAAFRQLQSLRALAAAAADPNSPDQSSAPAEWSEIRARLAETVEWLPELAADSDLNEQGWQHVQAAATAFNARLDQLGTSAMPPSAAAWQALDLAGLLKQLEPWLASADRARSSPFAPLAGSQTP